MSRSQKKDCFCVFDHITQVGFAVDKFHGKEVELKGRHGFRWRIGGLDDTVFKHNPRMMEEWERSFLPSPVKMEVIGRIDDFSLSGNSQWRQLVLMLGADRRVYGYDGVWLHLVAERIQQLFDEELVFPGRESFSYRLSSENMLDDDDNDGDDDGNETPQVPVQCVDNPEGSDVPVYYDRTFSKSPQSQATSDAAGTCTASGTVPFWE